MWLLARHRWRDLLFVATSIGGAAIFTVTLKEWIARARPVAFFRVAESGYSFPSGHTLSVTCLALTLGVLVWRGGASRRVKVCGSVALALIVAMVGLSRLVLGVHYPIDVLGSILLGIAWVSLLAALLYGPIWRAEEHGGPMERTGAPEPLQQG